MNFLNSQEAGLINRVDKKRDSSEAAISGLMKNHADIFDKEKIDEKNFSDIYETENIEGDKIAGEAFEIKRRESISKKMLLEMVRQACWLGEKAEIVGLSGYDAKETSGMAVLEIPIEEEGKIKILRVILDVTTNIDKEYIHREMEKSFDRNNEVKLNKVKYFQSEIDKNMKGKLENVPRVLIGLDFTHMKALCLDIAGTTNDQGKNPLQMILLAEMNHQLKDFLKQSEARKGKYDESSQILSRLVETVDTIIKIKKEAISGKYPSKEYQRNIDKVFAGITN